jgi:hypothetical protein
VYDLFHSSYFQLFTSKWYILVMVSEGPGTQKPGFKVLWRNGFVSWTRIFFNFGQIIWHNWWFVKEEHRLQNFEKSSTFGKKNEEKGLVQLAINLLFFGWADSGYYPKIRFWVHIRSITNTDIENLYVHEFLRSHASHLKIFLGKKKNKHGFLFKNIMMS